MDYLLESKTGKIINRIIQIFMILPFCLLSVSCIKPEVPSNSRLYRYEIVNTYPHDAGAFTQGLVFEDGVFYEGTGRYRQSTLRKVEPETGDVFQQHELDDKYFGEGIALCGDKIYQLTWKSNTGFVYDKASFEFIREFEYSTEGWGLTYDGQSLILSDGTSRLYFLDPETCHVTHTVDVLDGEQPVNRLNELEYIKGEIYANVWKTNRIVRINPQSGEVIAWIDLKGILDTSSILEPVDVLNGIAYDAQNDRLFVTGKYWPSLFEIRLVPLELKFN